MANIENVFTQPARVTARDLRSFGEAVLTNIGVCPEHATIVVDSLIEANLRGVDSHGMMRFAAYVRRVKEGGINPRAEGSVVKESEGTALMDANNGFGQVVATNAMSLAVQKSKTNGSAHIAVRNSNHFGMASYYAMMAAKENCIGIVLSNANPLMAPWGGREPLLGTNPLAVAIPSPTDYPFVLDMATSVVSRGKIIHAARSGQSVPFGWGLDPEGNPTTNASDILRGTLLPAAGPKGYGLSLFIDIICSLLSAGVMGWDVKSPNEQFSEGQGVSHFFAVIRIERFGRPDHFLARLDDAIRRWKQSPPAPGHPQIYMPGELEHLKAVRRRRFGIPLSPNVARELIQLGRDVGLSDRRMAFLLAAASQSSVTLPGENA